MHELMARQKKEAKTSITSINKKENIRNDNNSKCCQSGPTTFQQHISFAEFDIEIQKLNPSFMLKG